MQSGVFLGDGKEADQVCVPVYVCMCVHMYLHVCNSRGTGGWGGREGGRDEGGN